MAKTKTSEIIVGLDIGTTKIACIVGEVTDDGVDIIGVGTHPSTGLKKGVVVNIEATMASIQRVLEEAELMADCAITEVYTGIAGATLYTDLRYRNGFAARVSGGGDRSSRKASRG